MIGLDRCRIFVGVHGPYTVVASNAATWEEKQSAMEPWRAVTCMDQLWHRARYDESRLPLTQILELLGQRGPAVMRLRTIDMSTQVQKALETGRLLVLSEKREMPVYVGIPDPPPLEVRKPAKPNGATDWVEIQVVHKDGRPYAGPVRIEFPNGQTIEAKPDRSGQIRFDGILSGRCKVSLPGIDGAAWQ